MSCSFDNYLQHMTNRPCLLPKRCICLSFFCIAQKREERKQQGALFFKKKAAPLFSVCTPSQRNIPSYSTSTTMHDHHLPSAPLRIVPSPQHLPMLILMLLTFLTIIVMQSTTAAAQQQQQELLPLVYNLTSSNTTLQFLNVVVGINATLEIHVCPNVSSCSLLSPPSSPLHLEVSIHNVTFLEGSNLVFVAPSSSLNVSSTAVESQDCPYENLTVTIDASTTFVGETSSLSLRGGTFCRLRIVAELATTTASPPATTNASSLVLSGPHVVLENASFTQASQILFFTPIRSFLMVGQRVVIANSSSVCLCGGGLMSALPLSASFPKNATTSDSDSSAYLGSRAILGFMNASPSFPIRALKSSMLMSVTISFEVLDGSTFEVGTRRPSQTTNNNNSNRTYTQLLAGIWMYGALLRLSNGSSLSFSDTTIAVTAKSREGVEEGDNHGGAIMMDVANAWMDTLLLRGSSLPTSPGHVGLLIEGNSSLVWARCNMECRTTLSASSSSSNASSLSPFGCIHANLRNISLPTTTTTTSASSPSTLGLLVRDGGSIEFHNTTVRTMANVTTTVMIAAEEAQQQFSSSSWSVVDISGVYVDAQYSSNATIAFTDGAFWIMSEGYVVDTNVLLLETITKSNSTANTTTTNRVRTSSKVRATAIAFDVSNSIHASIQVLRGL